MVPAILIMMPILLMWTIGCSGPGPQPGAISGVVDGDVRRVEVLLSNYKFSPRDLVFELGDLVEYSFQSTDSIHTFTVEELQINWAVSAGERLTERFTFRSPGEFTLVCVIPSHETLGMKGTVIVR